MIGKLIMITKEQITEILYKNAGYVDRSRTELAVHEDNFNDVSDEILSKLSQKDVMFSFSDMIGFSKWLLSVDDMDNQNRYFYIEDKNDFIDDDRNRYTWEDMYRIYQKNCT